MGEMLALNMGLKHLDLSHCRLGPEACLLLGEGLKVRMHMLVAGVAIGYACMPHVTCA
jgi:hypothetical protein